MRTDPEKEYEFYDLKEWNDHSLDLGIFRALEPGNPSTGYVARSFSGHERNRLFMQTEDNFDDLTLVSGADFPKDSRGFVLLDFDRDGWMDLGITSPLSPRFQLFRNRLGDGVGDGLGDAKSKPSPRFVEFLLEGGASGLKRTSKWSSRDAVGAKLLVTIGDRKKMFQRSCGEGFAAQNSRWIHVGLGDAKQIDRVDITWPSGKKTTHSRIIAGERLRLKENGEVEKVSVSKSN